MTTVLDDTTSSAISAAITAERRRLGAVASGMVLTLIIITDEHDQSDATRAATWAANQHPCRILVVIPRPGKSQGRLDAEIDVGDRGSTGETVKLRLKGALADHPASVVLPLLLADTPVVAWWTGAAPEFPSEDPVGKLAQRRITDAAAVRSSLTVLDDRAKNYVPGDTDLSWTRITPWRSMLATALDEPFDQITSAKVGAQSGNPSGPLLASWLFARLHVPVSLQSTRGPGVTAVTLETARGKIQLTRTDGKLGNLVRPYAPTRRLPLPRRETRELIAEELRRLDPDEIYAQALDHLKTRPQKKAEPSAAAPAKKAAPKATKSANKKSVSSRKKDTK